MIIPVIIRAAGIVQKVQKKNEENHNRKIFCIMYVFSSLSGLQLDRPRPTTLLPSRSNCKPEAATVVDKLLMMGMRMPETC
jgi:hypothetical protein